MQTKQGNEAIGLHRTDSMRREQELCQAALDSGKFDDLSDSEWVAMCEKIARKAAEKTPAVAAS